MPLRRRQHLREYSPPFPFQAACADAKFGGFTLIELLMVIAVIGILASLLLSALSHTKMRAQAVICLNNTSQLGMAWQAYATDHEDHLPYNLAMSGKGAPGLPVSSKNKLNWVNNVMDWELNPDNVDSDGITEAGLSPYTSKVTKIYHCPADDVVSEVQRQAGWTARVRSYSMNAMVGDAGELTESGRNMNNPDSVQFFTMAAISRPANIFIFLDEHPDSINDGYFLNKNIELSSSKGYGGTGGNTSAEWIDLPASYHDGAASFSFADGHSENHRWKIASTKVAPIPDTIPFPLSVSGDDRGDLNWILEHMSVDADQK